MILPKMYITDTEDAIVGDFVKCFDNVESTNFPSLKKNEDNTSVLEKSDTSNVKIQEETSSESDLAQINLESFEDLVELFKNKGELLIHAQLVSCVHLVNFDTGKINIRIVGNTDRKIVKDISKNLKNWTGFDWEVNLVDDQGDETLDEKKK